MRVWARPFALVLLGLVGGCSAGLSGPSGADVLVLFVGNSLTSTHDVPGLVQRMADADGRSVAHVTIARADYSLEEHWFGGAPAQIRRLKPDFVVLQQGPSSLPESGIHLTHWSGRFEEVIREAGGEPVLYAVWPPLERYSFFPAVLDHYRAATEAVGGRLAPAGGTWLEAWSRAPDLALYGPDNFHPSYLGALAAAQTLYAVLFDAETIPSLSDGVSEEVLDVLRESVAASIAAWP